MNVSTIELDVASINGIARIDDDHGARVMRRRALLGAGLAGVASACSEFGGRVIDYCYRLRFIAEIGGAQHVGENIIRVRWRDRSGSIWPFGNSFDHVVWAEAPAADLGRHGLLFATLRRPGVGGAPYIIYALPELVVGYPNAPTGEAQRALITRVPEYRQEVFLPQPDWPLFVRFRTLTDPKSVEEVNAGTIQAIYGPGARIVSVSMQIVDERPTQGIRRTLPWLDGLNTNLAGERAHYVSGPIVGQLGANSFRVWGT